jgi:hypothetical protein
MNGEKQFGKNDKIIFDGREEKEIVSMLKEGMLKFRDYRGRDWFLEQIKTQN